MILLLMKGPRSYTTEDTVEIDCHGGLFVQRRILEAVLKNGARLAEPGEFTAEGISQRKDKGFPEADFV